MKTYVKGFLTLGIMTLCVILLGPAMNNADVVNAQITIGDNGNVGIKTGTYDPQHALDIVCNTSTNCGNAGNRRGINVLTQQASGSTGIMAEATNALGAVGLRGKASGGHYYSRGVWGSASGTDSYGGYFTGGLYVSGGITHGSDERLKTNIHSLRDESMLSRIRQLNPTRYEFLPADQLRQRGMPASHAEEGEHLGLMAQEVEQVFPELVRDVVHILNEEDRESGEEWTPETTTAKGIDYNGLIVALIAAVQEQQEEIEELKRRLDQNERR